MTIYRAALFAASVLVLLPSIAWSDEVGLLNTFNPGETARASEVNENFDAVKSAVDDNHARIVDLENAVGVPGPQGAEGPQGLEGPQGEQGLPGVGISNSPKAFFATSEEFDGNLGGIAGADAKCQNAADAAGLGGTWKAWIAANDASTVPASRFSFSAYGYERLDGLLLGGTNLDSFPAAILRRPDIDENGQAIPELPSTHAWTGVDGVGRRDGPFCQDWTSNDPSDAGNAGNLDTGPGSGDLWTRGYGGNCGLTKHLYCFEQ